MAAVTSVRSEKCCHLVSEREASAGCLCSVRQFLIYSTWFVLCYVCFCKVSGGVCTVL